MPLSEHEQRLLDQIERGLHADDPKFAQTVQATDPRMHYKRRMIKAAIGFVAGVCLLMAGVISKLIIIGVVGFVVMLACCVWGLSSWKRMAGIGTEKAAAPKDTPKDTPQDPPKQQPKQQPKQPRKEQKGPKAPRPPRPQRGKFMERLEERWRRRREDGR